MSLSALDALDELLGGEEKPAEQPKFEYFYPIDSIEVDCDQVRRDHHGETVSGEDEEALGELAQNIQKFGVIEPIVIRPHPEAPGKYLIVAGERRWRASRQAGLTDIPAVLKDDDVVSNPATRMLIQLTENIQRHAMKPHDIGAALGRILATSGLSKSELAKQLGKTPAFVSKHLALTKCEGLDKAAVEKKLFTSADTFQEFKGLPEDKKQDLIDAAVESGGGISISAVIQAKEHDTPQDGEVLQVVPDIPSVTLPTDEEDEAEGEDLPPAEPKPRTDRPKKEITLVLNRTEIIHLAGQVGLDTNVEDEELLQNFKNYLTEHCA